MSELRNKIDELETGVKNSVQKNKKRMRIFIALALVVAFLLGIAAEFIYRNITESDRARGFRTIDTLIDEIQSNYYKDVNRDELIAAAIKGMFTELDPYSMAYTYEEYTAIRLASQGQSKNFGYSVRTLPRRPVSIARVTGGSPAERAGLKAGDEIVGIKYYGEEEYNDVSYKSYNDVYAMLTNSSKPKYSLQVQRAKTAALLAALESGKSGSALYAEIDKPENHETVDCGLMATEEYSVKYVYYYIDASEGGTNITDTLLTKDLANEFAGSDTAYIKLTEFSGTADKEFEDAMEIFKTARKERLILDLRDNPGGNTNVLGVIASYLIYNKINTNSPVPIFVAKYNDKSTERYMTRKRPLIAGGNYTDAVSKYEDYFGDYNQNDKKITVLVNGSSASASEALSSAIQDYGTGTVVGTTTYKKGIMQSTYYLPSINYYLKVTVAVYYSAVFPDKTLDGVGITPAGGNFVEDNYYSFENCRSLLSDSQFLRALVLSGVATE